MKKSYRDLEIYQLSMDLAVKLHFQSLKLPKHELYETGSQIRRSSKSIPANISEGYDRKRYKDEFIRFLIFSHSSCNETLTHLELLDRIYKNDYDFNLLYKEYDFLGGKINNFIKFVGHNWKR